MCLRATHTALQQCKLPSACSHRVLRLHNSQPRRPSGCCRRAWTSASAHSLHDIANSSDHPVPPAELLEIGLIHTTHGVRGELKVEALTDFPEERLTVAGKRWLQAVASEPKECFLERGRSTVSKGREVWIVKLQGIDSLNDSQLLRGQTLLVDSADRPFLEDEDEFLTQDLIGASVILQQDGSPVGTVVDVYDGTGPGAHDLLKIQLSHTMLQTRSKRTTMLLPFVKEFVPLIDVEDNVIHVCPPAGLVEMALNPTVKSKLAAKDKRGSQTQ